MNTPTNIRCSTLNKFLKVLGTIDINSYPETYSLILLSMEELNNFLYFLEIYFLVNLPVDSKTLKYGRSSKQSYTMITSNIEIFGY